MLKSGTGSLSEINNSIRNRTAEKKENVRVRHGEYIKFPFRHKVKLDRSSLTELQCDICESGLVAVTSCLECKQSLCITCRLRHRNMRSSIGHHLQDFLVNGNDIVKDRVESTTSCVKHHMTEKMLYCLECSETLCIYCKLLYHQKHATIDTSEVAPGVVIRLAGPHSENASHRESEACDTTFPDRIDTFSRFQSGTTVSPDDKNLYTAFLFSPSNAGRTDCSQGSKINIPRKLLKVKRNAERFNTFMSSIECGTNLKSLRDQNFEQEGDSSSTNSTSCDPACRLCIFSVVSKTCKIKEP